jgi:hypothetical protein
MVLREMATSAQEKRLAHRVAKLKEALFGATEQIATLEQENAGLRAEELFDFF